MNLARKKGSTYIASVTRVNEIIHSMKFKLFSIVIMAGLSAILYSHYFNSYLQEITQNKDDIPHHNALSKTGNETRTVEVPPEEMNQLSIRSRSYPGWTHDFPCVADLSQESKDEGLIYIKVHKCASTTIANIVRDISSRYGEKILKFETQKKCKAHFSHGEAFNLLNITKRKPDKSFLFTVVREPTERFISDFFYHGVSKAQRYIPSLSNFTKFVDWKTRGYKGLGGYEFPYLLTDMAMVPPQTPEYTFWDPDRPKMVKNPMLLKERVESTLSDYDFIGVAGSRLDESLVVLSMLLNITLVDVLYPRSARVSGGYDVNKNKDGCFAMKKAELTEEMEKYFKSDEWKAKIAGDEMLYRAANLSLNRTIESIGKDKFELKLNRYNKFKKLMDAVCGGIDCSPCSKTGEFIGENRDFRCTRKYCLSKFRKARKELQSIDY